jgi:hypothetical protein
LEEEAWARHIRNDDQVMGPVDVHSKEVRTMCEQFVRHGYLSLPAYASRKTPAALGGDRYPRWRNIGYVGRRRQNN